MSDRWRWDPSWLAFLATVATLLCALALLAAVTLSREEAAGRETPHTQQVLVLLTLNGPATLENADQLSAVVAAIRRRGLSKSIDVLTANSDRRDLEAALNRVRLQDLLLIIAPSASRDVVNLADILKTRFAGVPLLFVSSTAPSVRELFSKDRVHFATDDNQAIARELFRGISREKGPSGALSVCFATGDEPYAVDLGRQTVRAIESGTAIRFEAPHQVTDQTSCYEQRPPPSVLPNECTALLIGTPDWFMREKSRLPACPDVVLADGLITAAVERALRHEAARTLWAVEPECDRVGEEQARGVMFWGRVALPSLLAAFEPVPNGAALSRELVSTRLRNVRKVGFKFRKL